MRKRITWLIAALMLAPTMSFGSMAAFADTLTCQDAQKNPNWDCKGNKLSNPGPGGEHRQGAAHTTLTPRAHFGIATAISHTTLSGGYTASGVGLALTCSAARCQSTPASLQTPTPPRKTPASSVAGRLERSPATSIVL